MTFSTNVLGAKDTDKWVRNRRKGSKKKKIKLPDTIIWTFYTVCTELCVCVHVCHTEAWDVVCHLGPLCRLLTYPRILLGASHTWVAHSSWTLHIQIAVMNIIREEHWGAVQGTQTHKYTLACECTNTYVNVHTTACSASCIWSSTYRADDTKVCRLFSEKTHCLTHSDVLT